MSDSIDQEASHNPAPYRLESLAEDLGYLLARRWVDEVRSTDLAARSWAAGDSNHLNLGSDANGESRQET